MKRILCFEGARKMSDTKETDKYEKLMELLKERENTITGEKFCIHMRWTKKRSLESIDEKIGTLEKDLFRKKEIRENLCKEIDEENGRLDIQLANRSKIEDEIRDLVGDWENK